MMDGKSTTMHSKRSYTFRNVRQGNASARFSTS
jgi:hypothetical protein